MEEDGGADGKIRTSVSQQTRRNAVALTCQTNHDRCIPNSCIPRSGDGACRMNGYLQFAIYMVSQIGLGPKRNDVKADVKDKA